MNSSPITSGVLLLSHCGFSFMEDLLALVAQRGQKSFVLSSLPLPEHPQRLQDLAEKCNWLNSSESHELLQADVQNTLDRLAALGFKVSCCICVWEGYRGLMAYANQQLGVPDMAQELTHLFRDKLEVRRQMRDAGLSKVDAIEVTKDNIEQLKQAGRPLFLKPRRGIASFGAFTLRPDTSWMQLQGILKEAQNDVIYRSVIDETTSFIVEDYVPGKEVSFEVICHNAKPYVVALHEKLEVTEMGNTTLEDCCVSPPLNISRQAIATGIDWLNKVCEKMHLDSGCYHIEARCYEGTWELIEINLRVGGALISASVKATTDGHSMLELWLDVLLCGAGLVDEEEFSAKLERIALGTDGSTPSDMATFFRVYFAHAGVIQKIELQEISYQPIVTQILLKEGDIIPESDREVFLAQILWTMKLSQQADVVAVLVDESKNTLKVTYELPINC